MINPTTGYELQFTSPYDILPNIIYTNPTQNQSQFVNAITYPNGDVTFNYNYPGEIVNFKPKNPTVADDTQFLRPISYPFIALTTFNYAYPYEKIDFRPDNPTFNITQFTLTPTDTSTGFLYNTFNYDYPNEITNFKPKNPTSPQNTDVDTKYGSFPDPNKLTAVDSGSGKSYNTFTFNYPNKPTGSLTNTTVLSSTNLQLSSFITQGTGVVGNIIGGVLGIPQISQLTDSIIAIANGNESTYSTMPFNKLRAMPGIKYSDFRSRKVWDLNDLQKLGKPRLDGASAGFRRGGGGSGIAYSIAAVSPAGAYSVFNLDGFGKTGYGWGDHDNTYATRFDFTARSAAALKWNTENKYWEPTKNPIEFANPFRGDRVTIIDFNKRKLDNAYVWRKQRTQTAYDNKISANDKTQDFIKFFLTGPLLQPGSKKSDDIIVFRATINSLSDTFSPEWSPINMIGRADPNYQYGGVNRDLSLDFTVYATDRDELQPIWRKLNALAGYTAPTYDISSIAYRAPWIRFTIGDLFRQQPAIITSLAYTLHDQETTWEINIERDPTMAQVPHKVSVSLGLSLVTNELPQNGGRFYSLTSNEGFKEDGQTANGSSNWLSDFLENPDTTELDNKYLPTLPNVGLTSTAPADVNTVVGNNGAVVAIGGNDNAVAGLVGGQSTNTDSSFSNLIAGNETTGTPPIFIKTFT